MGFTKKITSEESRRCPQCAQPFCLQGCPLGVDIPGFVRLLREADAPLALEKIKKDNPFPAICGRICTAPCEDLCVFHEEGSPIAIRSLERYAADFGRITASRRSVRTFNGKKVAIVGSGPSAMMAASFLLKDGFDVEMFEAANQPGGVLRYGIPEFRLPQQVLEAQFEELESQGLKIHTNVFIGRMKSLADLSHSFDAVLLATGASLPNFSSLDGENLIGVYYAEEFLMRLQVQSKSNILLSAGDMVRGLETVVIGKGYAALDAARMAARLGQKVQWIFEGLEEEMGLTSDDLRESLDEGIDIQSPYKVLGILGNSQNHAQAVQCHRMEIVEGLGGLSLQPAKEAPVVFEAQTVILANGQKANAFLSSVTGQLKVNANGTLCVDDKTSLTNLEKVFAVASAVQGPMTVVDAFACGKAVAQKITDYLK